MWLPQPLQIKAHVEKLLTKKKEMLETWDKHWEWLQQSECPTGLAPVPAVLVTACGTRGAGGAGDRVPYPQCWRCTSSPRRPWWPTRG